MMCFTAEQIEELDLTGITENTAVSAPASSDEEVCFGET